MKTSHRYALWFALFAACTDGSSGGGGDPAADAPASDAPSTIDGAVPDGPAGTTAAVVDCAGTMPVGDVWYYDGIGYIGSGMSIAVGGIIRFHDLGAHTADSVQGLWNFSGDQDQCVRFDGAGTFAFRCYFHSEEQGEIIVQ